MCNSNFSNINISNKIIHDNFFYISSDDETDDEFSARPLFSQPLVQVNNAVMTLPKICYKAGVALSTALSANSYFRGISIVTNRNEAPPMGSTSLQIYDPQYNIFNYKLCMGIMAACFVAGFTLGNINSLINKLFNFNRIARVPLAMYCIVALFYFSLGLLWYPHFSSALNYL
ncbi:hypothetical protein ACL2XG_15205 [Sodalis sp. RH24]|uniref:hypothetical protein n=1 Tax=unclassified Sodalis (in: enterobacteria) TaxID=2636512 RepID=UPI003965C728